jgi:hypothetical protein
MARWAAMSSLPRFVLQPKMMSKNTKLAGGRLEMECKLRDPEMQRNLEGENGERERERERERDEISLRLLLFKCRAIFLLFLLLQFSSQANQETSHAYHFVNEKLKLSVKFYFF